MAKGSKDQAKLKPGVKPDDGWLTMIESDAPLCGIPGPGRWLVFEYQPTALFSLKTSLATSSVGKTLLVPTPYSVKMAFVDAGFRIGLSWDECAALVRCFASASVRLAPPGAAVVTHTFVKIRQESRDADPLHPYTSNIAYRELVHYQGVWRWAFDLAAGDAVFAERLVRLAPHVNYVGKRGSFVQFRSAYRLAELGGEFTCPVDQRQQFYLPGRAHVVPLDDFGPEADLGTLCSFSAKRAERGKHRRFVDTLVPLGVVNSGPGFTEYSAGGTISGPESSN